jgi:polyribonucleotide nucleotidyltransferase
LSDGLENQWIAKWEVMVAALKQAKEGRLHILNEIKKTISAPRSDYKSHAPRIVTLKLLIKNYRCGNRPWW